jgi:hypothetical protein
MNTERGIITDECQTDLNFWICRGPGSCYRLFNTSHNEIQNLQQAIADLKGEQQRLSLKSADLSSQLQESKNQYALFLC